MLSWRSKGKGIGTDLAAGLLGRGGTIGIEGNTHPRERVVQEDLKSLREGMRGRGVRRESMMMMLVSSN